MSLLLDALQRARQTGDADVALSKGASSASPSIAAPDWTLDQPPIHVPPEVGAADGGMAAGQDTSQAAVSADRAVGLHAKVDAEGSSAVVSGTNPGAASIGTTPAPANEALDRRRAAQHILEGKVSGPSPARHRSVVWVAIGGAALVAVAGLGWWVWEFTRPVAIVAQTSPMPNVGPAQVESLSDGSASATRDASAGPVASEPPPAAPSPPVLPTRTDAATSASTSAASPTARSESSRHASSRRVAQPARVPAVASVGGSALRSPAQAGGDNTSAEGGAFRIERDGWPQWLVQAQAAAESGDWAAALERYTAVLAQRPSELQALIGQAVALHRLQRWPAALQAYERVLQVVPQQAEARYGWASVLARVDPDRAEREMQEWLLQQPADSGVWLALGMLYGRQGRWGLSAQALQRAVDIEPQRVEAVFNWAVALDHTGRISEAIAAYRRALALPLDVAARAQVQRRVQQLSTAQSEGDKTDERGE